MVKSDAVQRIIVRRSNVWEDSLKQFIKGLSYNKTIKVTFVGEPAVDSGGPRREYFTLLIRAIAMNNSLFEGDTDRRLPRINVSALIKKLRIFPNRKNDWSILAPWRVVSLSSKFSC